MPLIDRQLKEEVGSLGSQLEYMIRTAFRNSEP
jgi:hypothetical protein